MKNERIITSAVTCGKSQDKFLPTKLLQVQMTASLLRNGADIREDRLLEMEDLQF